jgi:hypothetical protein
MRRRRFLLSFLPLPLTASPSFKMPQVDYAIVFSTSTSYSPVRSFGDKSEAQVRRLRAEQLKEEYNKLVTLLKAANLDVTVRRGAPGTDTLLLFVKAHEKRVREEATRER